MPDFKNLLSKKTDDIKRPALLPHNMIAEGIVMDYNMTEAQTENKDTVVRFNIKLTGPGNGVDPDDLIDKDGNDIIVADRRMRAEFWATEDALWRLVEFVKSCGVETAGRSLGECLPETKNAPVFVTIVQVPDKQKKEEDGTPVTYNNVSKVVGQNGPVA